MSLHRWYANPVTEFDAHASYTTVYVAGLTSLTDDPIAGDIQPPSP